MYHRVDFIAQVRIAEYSNLRSQLNTINRKQAGRYVVDWSHSYHILAQGHVYLLGLAKYMKFAFTDF